MYSKPGGDSGSPDGPTITSLSLAEAVRDHLGAAGAKVTLQEAPDVEPAALMIHNDRAKREFGWQPRSVLTTIADTVDSLRELDLLAAQ